MRIAIQAADLDYYRIDGTRVYILNMLRRFGKLSPEDEFIIYHKKDFNPELAPPNFSCYQVKKITSPLCWTQTRLAYELIKDKPDALWMPMHNLPLLKNKKIKTTVTLHDLAFKIFPHYFLPGDLFKLNFLTNLAVKRADKIIAVSQSSKKDILKFYPSVAPEKIRVIYHGFDAELFNQARNEEKEKALKDKLGIKGAYLLYSGAIQPRKNLKVLIAAFEWLKNRKADDELKKIQLVLAGEKAWMSDEIINEAKASQYSSDIILPGKIKFEDIGHLMRGASVYVFPSLYEGFGITVLEAMAAGAPVICSRNSSLPEVGGEAALYFDDENSSADLAEKIERVLKNQDLKKDLIKKGLEQIKKFSWDKCAQETLEWIKE